MNAAPADCNCLTTKKQQLTIDKLATRVTATRNVQKSLQNDLDKAKSRIKELEEQLRRSGGANDNLRHRNGQLCKQIDNLRGHQRKVSIGTQTINEEEKRLMPMWKYSNTASEKFIASTQSFHFGQYSRSKVDIYCNCEVFGQFSLLHFSLITKNDITHLSIPLLKQNTSLKITAKLREGTRVIQRRTFSPITFKIPGLYGPKKMIVPLKLLSNETNFKLQKDQSFIVGVAPHSTLNKLVDPVRAQFCLQDFIIYGQIDLQD